MREILIRAIGEQSEATPDEDAGAIHSVEWGGIQSATAPRIPAVAFNAIRRQLARDGYLDDSEAYAMPPLLEHYFERYHPHWRRELKELARDIQEKDETRTVAARTGHSLAKTSVMFDVLKRAGVIGIGLGSGDLSVTFIDEGERALFCE
jgi:hypothetical protein